MFMHLVDDMERVLYGHFTLTRTHYDFWPGGRYKDANPNIFTFPYSKHVFIVFSYLQCATDFQN